MNRIDAYSFDFEKRKGEILHCVELVSNDDEEIGKDLFEFETEEEAVEKAEELNKANKDKKYKYIAINYLVEEDGFIAY